MMTLGPMAKHFAIAAALLPTMLAGASLSHPTRANAQTPHLPMCSGVESLYATSGVAAVALRLDHCTGNVSVDSYYSNYTPTSQDVLKAILTIHGPYTIGQVVATSTSNGGATTTSTGYHYIGCPVGLVFGTTQYFYGVNPNPQSTAQVDEDPFTCN